MSTLDTWESKLKDRVCSEQILFGELGFRRSDLDEIGDLIRYRRIIGLHGKELSEREKIEHVSRRWPLTYALFLVLGGIYDYQSGEYWDGPCKRLGLPSDQTDRWGQRFLDILAEYDLPTFEHSGGLTYVTPILLHGGIPNDFLDAFFDFLWKQEKKHHQISLDSISLLQTWRQQPEEYFRYLPASVRRFLEYGGKVASDFVERCLELFDTDSLEEVEALVDLPPRVVCAFERWRNGKNIPTRMATPRVGLQRPILSIAPYTEGVTLYLPAQQFPHRIAPRELVWRLADSAQSIYCNMRRIEGGTQFEVQERIYVSPALQYVLHLEADGERLQTWTLPGLAEPPVLFFDPYDDYEGEVLLEQRRFHSGERWLLYPQSCQWQETGSSRKLRALPELSGVWQGYRLEAWQLAPGAMALQDEHGRSYSFNVIHEKAQQRPRLIDGNRPPLPITAADFPLYIGRPPTLILYTDQPHRWQVAIRAAGRAQPDDHRPRRVSQLPFVPAKDSLCLDLAIPELLGEKRSVNLRSCYVGR